MSRKPTTHELEALIAAHAAEIAALKAENEKLAQRVLHLEEQLRLERLHRYAPKSEKLKERIFNEAEQAAADERHRQQHARARARRRLGLLGHGLGSGFPPRRVFSPTVPNLPNSRRVAIQPKPL